MFQRNTFVSALLASALALPAFAQDAAAPAAPAPAAAPAEPEVDSRSEIEVINVTARKISENLQDTPVAVSAFSAESLEGLGISDTQDISSMAPNLYLTQTPGSAANLALSIRGVAGAEPLLTREQGVAVYMDDAYIARVTGAIMDLVDIERVEVLRGPQGTLYGRNSTGGAIKFISRKPTEDFNATQRFGTGSWSHFESLTRINTGEIATGFTGAFAYLHRQEDGYRNNRLASDKHDFGAGNTDAFRIAFGWQPSEEIRFDYAYDNSNLKGNGPGFQLVAVSPTLAGALTAGGVNLANLQIGKREFNSLSNDFDGVSEHTIKGHNLQMEWDLGVTNFNMIVTRREWDNTEAGTELDGNDLGTVVALTLPFFAPAVLPDANLFDATNERHQDQWSVETRLDGDLGEQFNYVAGFYYFNENFSEENFQRFLFPFSPFAPPLSLSNPFVYSGEARSWALFGNLTWTAPFLDDKLSFSGGVRYTSDEKAFNRVSPISSSDSQPWNSVDWDAAINFAATEEITLYFRGASAYKAGGYNLRSALPVIVPFDEERVKSVELGLKSGWFDNRAQLNLAGFWSISRARQTDVFAAGPGGATSITINAGEAVIPGLELETILIPVDGLTISGNVGWISPKYNSYPIFDPTPSPDPVVDLAHEAGFGYQPKVTASIGAAYETAPLGSLGLVLTARIDEHYTGSRIWSPLDDERSTNNPVVTAFRDILRDGSYWLTDVRFSVSEISIGETTKIRASVYGKNVLDSSYMLSGIDFGALGFAGAAYGEGATWGMDVTLDF